MNRTASVLLIVAASLTAAGCQRPAATADSVPPRRASPGQSESGPRGIRTTGTVRAVLEHVVLVPRIRGQSGRTTLTWIIPNGTIAAEGELVAEFDRTEQIDKAREALAKFEDLQHQVEQRKAENRANTETRAEAMSQAQADFDKAKLQQRVAEVLSVIERDQNAVTLEDTAARVASLTISHRQHDIADQAALRLLEIKMGRERAALERAESNAEKLQVRAPFSGMVAHEYVWRQGSRGPPQIGDQMYRGRPLLRIFDPSEMEVLAQVGEPDADALNSGARALVTLDAYPGLTFEGRLISASPVAAAALGSPIKRFQARFRLDQTDPHLLPDLAAAVVILPGEHQ